MSDQDQKTIIFKQPIVLGDLTYDSITLREPTLEELDQAMKQESKLGMVAMLIAATSGIPLAAARKIKVSDMSKASEFLTGFMSDFPSTGVI